MKKAEPADFPKFEADMLKTWAEEQTFEQSLANREGKPVYSFYDGPPFANGLPHFGHTLVTSIKDSIGRYRTMRGYYVARRNGWDCHGLPVEFAIEKELGVSGKKQILELGLDVFNQACRDSVFKYKGDWEDFFRRAGRWTDTEHSYATIDRDYTESVWWGLKGVAAKDLLYRGYKSMPYCPRCETPLSNFELNEGYQDNVSDPSVFVKFGATDQENTSYLAWTTTPWSLAANVALAVDKAADYVTVELLDDGDSWAKGEKLILAKARLDVLSLRKAEYKVIETVKGSQLVGASYVSLYPEIMKQRAENAAESGKVYTIFADDSVSLEDGTGILHVAPRYGETDLALGQKEQLPLIESVNRSGKATEVVGRAAGLFFKDADPLIIADLEQAGRIFAAESFQHTYPFCYRCESPLLYFAISTWFIKVSEIREQLLKTAEQIDWTPGHIKDGRFGKWLEGARDWAISRNRYWGAPLPIWVNTADESDYIVVESLAQLCELAGLQEAPEDLHRPFIDEITFTKDGKDYKRVEEVFDCWFESGSMPFAQQHYPFENKETFEASFPADYIGEGLDQTRLWFYVQHVLSTILFDRPAYKHVLVNGMVMAADGQKLSKRLKNYPPVEEVFAKEGADTLRFYLLGNDQAVGGDYMRFNRDAMVDIQRNVFATIWNTYSFLSMYAEIDKWEPGKTLAEPTSDNVLDQWILARLNQVITEMTEAADGYELAQALRPFRGLVDDLSNWYVRRSRRRFWKSDDDGDKASAYATLHYVLVRLSQLLAPWSPFVADKLWRELTAGMDVPASVHLSDWPVAGETNPELIEQMRLAREVVTMGLAERATAGIKVRQPLSILTIELPVELSPELVNIVVEEVNVKDLKQAKKAKLNMTLNTEITQELKYEGMARDIVRHIQSLRKKTGLEVDDRINLTLGSESAEVRAAITAHEELIKAETLATTFDLTEKLPHDVVPVRVSGEDLGIALNKA
jgi:isoleucyl-tRNA synthetase